MGLVVGWLVVGTVVPVESSDRRLVGKLIGDYVFV